jgi:two-component system response regulator RegX3
MRAALRRTGDSSGAIEAGDAVVIGDLVVDADRHVVMVAGAEVTMPLKEFELLHLLALNAGRVLTRETLIDRIWGFDYVGDTKTLDVHIKRLRSKVEADPSQPTRITTIRGVGYRLERPKNN